jgi:hypothetical protein
MVTQTATVDAPDFPAFDAEETGEVQHDLAIVAHHDLQGVPAVGRKRRCHRWFSGINRR